MGFRMQHERHGCDARGMDAQGRSGTTTSATDARHGERRAGVHASGCTARGRACAKTCSGCTGDLHGVIASTHAGSGELPTLLQPPEALICLPRPPSRLPLLEATLRLPPHCGVRHGRQRVQDACQQRENHLRAPRPPRPRSRAAAPWARTLDVIICP
jgi:hypothetical protein